jgi:hypothetical protein
VRDATTNAAVPNATVTLTTINGVQQAKTDGTGRYAFPDVPPGQSLLSVDSNGLHLEVKIAVQTDQDVSKDLLLDKLRCDPRYVDGESNNEFGMRHSLLSFSYDCTTASTAAAGQILLPGTIKLIFSTPAVSVEGTTFLLIDNPLTVSQREFDPLVSSIRADGTGSTSGWPGNVVPCQQRSVQELDCPAIFDGTHTYSIVNLGPNGTFVGPSQQSVKALFNTDSQTQDFQLERTFTFKPNVLWDTVGVTTETATRNPSLVNPNPTNCPANNFPANNAFADSGRVLIPEPFAGAFVPWTSSGNLHTPADQSGLGPETFRTGLGYYNPKISKSFAGRIGTQFEIEIDAIPKGVNVYVPADITVTDSGGGKRAEMVRIDDPDGTRTPVTPLCNTPLSGVTVDAAGHALLYFELVAREPDDQTPVQMPVNMYLGYPSGTPPTTFEVAFHDHIFEKTLNDTISSLFHDLDKSVGPTIAADNSSPVLTLNQKVVSFDCYLDSTNTCQFPKATIHRVEVTSGKSSQRVTCSAKPRSSLENFLSISETSPGTNKTIDITLDPSKLGPSLQSSTTMVDIVPSGNTSVAPASFQIQFNVHPPGPSILPGGVVNLADFRWGATAGG